MAPEMLQEIFDAAEMHGEDDDPDHEVGDLQQALQLAWRLLDEHGRKTVHHEFMLLRKEEG